MERSNSARRLFTIADAIQKLQADQVPTLWANLFGIKVDGSRHVVEVAGRLVWINEEIDRMEEYFRAIPDYDRDLYEEPARRFRAAASPLLLSNCRASKEATSARGSS
jgi:hypothetical protein